MSPPDRLLERRELAADVYMPAAFRTIGLVLGLIALYFIAGPGRISPFIQPLLGSFFMPAAAGAVAWYLRSLVPVFFEGRMVLALRDAFTVLAVVLFVAITASSFSGISAFALPLLLAGGAFILYLLGSAYSDPGRIIARALLLGAVGLCPLLIAGFSGPTGAVALGWMTLVGFWVAAALSLAGLLADHSNKYLAYAGKVSGSGGMIILVASAIFLLLAYARFLRPGFAVAWGGSLVIAEWLALLIVLALAGYRIWSFSRAISEDRQFGDLRMLVQTISYDKKGLETAAAAVDDFVERGRKEGLIVYLTRVMLDNSVPPKAIEGILAGIVGCRDDPEPPLMLRWTKGDIARRNRERRLAAVNEAVFAGAALAKPESAISAGFTAEEAAPLEVENVPIIT
jgi:hypothetical protein